MEITDDDGNDPRMELVSIILSSKTPEEFYERISRAIVTDDDSINFFFFDIGAMLVRAFYEKSRLTTTDIIPVKITKSEPQLN